MKRVKFSFWVPYKLVCFCLKYFTSTFQIQFCFQDKVMTHEVHYDIILLKEKLPTDGWNGWSPTYFSHYYNKCLPTMEHIAYYDIRKGLMITLMFENIRMFLEKNLK